MSLRRYRCEECAETFYALTSVPRCQNCTPIEVVEDEQVEEPKLEKRKRRTQRDTE